MSYVESTIVMRTFIYNQVFDEISFNSNTLETVLIREEENMDVYTNINYILRHYSSKEVNKCLNMSLLEYLNLTPQEKIQIDKFCDLWLKERYDEMVKLESATNKKIEPFLKGNKNETTQTTSQKILQNKKIK